MKLNILLFCLLTVSIVDWLLLLKETVRNDINRIKMGLGSYGQSTYIMLGTSIFIVVAMGLLAIPFVPPISLNIWLSGLVSFFGYFFIRVIESLVTLIVRGIFIRHGQQKIKVAKSEQKDTSIQ